MPLYGTVIGSHRIVLDGSPYIKAEDGITISTGSNGTVHVGVDESLINRYVFNEAVILSQSEGIWSGSLSHSPDPTSSLMFFMNGQLLSQGASDDYTLSGSNIELSNDVRVTLEDKFFATYRR